MEIRPYGSSCGESEENIPLLFPQLDRTPFLWQGERREARASHVHTEPFVKSAMRFNSKWNFYICDSPFVLLIRPLLRFSEYLTGWGRKNMNVK